MHRLIVAGALAAILSGCAVEDGDERDAGGNNISPAPVAGSSFASEIVPLLRTRCATCHLTGQEAGKMALTPGAAHASLVGVRAEGAPGLTRVIPGDPDNSYLVMKLEGTHIARGGAGAQMPFGAPPIASGEIAMIRRWIAEGAQQ